MGDLARLLHVHVYVYHVVGLPYAGFLHCCCVEGSAVMQPGCECQSVGLLQYCIGDSAGLLLYCMGTFVGLPTTVWRILL